MLHLNEQFIANRKLENIVENRSVYTLERAELNIFETHSIAEQIYLQFPSAVLASMITGKKIMHLKDLPPFNFFPGESIILPSNELMCIDFPEAQFDNPTQCIALSISDETILQAIETLNKTGKKENGQPWGFVDFNYHFTNDEAIYQILQRLIFIFTENHPSKDLFSNFMIQELLIRILQIQSKGIYLEKAKYNANANRINFVVSYIREHITEDLNMGELSKKVYLSESSFYRVFKNEMGCSPNDFIIDEKIKLAEEMLKQPNINIKEAYLASGFNSFSYFCRIFKKKKKLSPSDYKEKMLRWH